MITRSTQMKQGEKARFPYGSPAAPRCHGGEQKPLQSSAPLCEGWHPASLCQTPAAELAGDTALEERDTRKPKIKSHWGWRQRVR